MSSTYQPGSFTEESPICLNLNDTLFPEKFDTSYSISTHGMFTELEHDQPPDAATYCLPSHTFVPINPDVLVIVPSYQFVLLE